MKPAGPAVTLPGLVGVGHTLRARVQRLPPGRADALLAVAVAAAGVIPIVLLAPARQMPAALAIVLVQAVGLAYRRRRPLFVWCLGFGVIVPVTFLPMPVNDVLIAAFVGVIFASYSLGANLESERGWWVVAVVGVAATIAQAVYDQTTDSKLSDVVWGGFAMLIAPVLVGRVVRRRGQLNATLRARAEAAGVERERADAGEFRREAGTAGDATRAEWANRDAAPVVRQERRQWS